MACLNVHSCESVTGPDNSSIIIGNLTENNYTCLRYEFTVHLSVKYQTVDNKTSVVTFVLPSDSKLLNGTNLCSNQTYENFTLWSDFANFSLSFKSSEKSVFLDSIEVHLNLTRNPNLFPNAVNKCKFLLKCCLDLPQTHILSIALAFTLTDLNPNFNVDKSHSYVCSNNVTIPKNDNSDLHVIFSNLRAQAFMEPSRNGTFSEGK